LAPPPQPKVEEKKVANKPAEMPKHKKSNNNNRFKEYVPDYSKQNEEENKQKAEEKETKTPLVLKSAEKKEQVTEEKAPVVVQMEQPKPIEKPQPTPTEQQTCIKCKLSFISQAKMMEHFFSETSFRCIQWFLKS